MPGDWRSIAGCGHWGCRVRPGRCWCWCASSRGRTRAASPSTWDWKGRASCAWSIASSARISCERRVGGDRRVKTVHLTRKGEELSTEIWRVAGHLRKELLRDIPLDDVARAMTLLTLLQGRLARLA